ncbi:receptor-like serine/threonine-protein kinase SD1-8 isoform X1 [Asparagus officinalis]|uniref:receptor-like serine/threonine-protein kinase SD1-8 isoform X1 n=1 Tax=Asparagus officinalis TaxID=4686 RepID=UPI00098E2FDC|nr:receptor-like serine/threonine-protein kinase SD1-8 isoform X1 [Asparagus officinalis]
MSYDKSFLILFIFILCSFSLSVSRDTLTPNQLLSGNETLVSSDGAFSLGFFSPTNSTNNRYIGIWYTRIPVQTVIWVGNRKNRVSDPMAALMLTSNGSLLVTDGSSKVFLSSLSMMAVGKPVAQLLDTGNFVIRDSQITDSNSFAWQSFDHPTDTLIPGMKLGWNLTSGLNRNLTAWSSSTDPSPGNYTLALDLRGDPQLILWNGHILQGRYGPWTGLHFSWLSSQVDPNNKDALVYLFVNNKEEVYYSAGVVNKSIITRLVVNALGVAERYFWRDKSWGQVWYIPSGQCDRYAPCGPYGSCVPNGYANGSPNCSCLQGFEPKSPANRDSGYISAGCVRKTKLDCRTDGFKTVPRTLLPDTVSATVNRTMSLDECQAACLRNCSCTGFSSADIRGSGSGCIIWSMDLIDIASSLNGGQDFYLRLAAKDIGLAAEDIGLISSQSHKSGDAALAVSLSVVLGVISLLVSVACYAWRKLKWTRGNAFVKEDDMELPFFELVEIEAATNNFSNENKLGEGGFGPVYKMREGQEIAVKRLSKTSLQGLGELKTEVMLMAKLQHRNLVRLLGCCLEGDERILIYEFMPNKSLDTFLFDEEKVALLDWRMRYQIILGIARGLLYLHQDSRLRIIHRDLKAGNILLDKDMIPKISDFGLARLFGEDETETQTRRVVGTYGYMPPEYALNGIFSVKSDVFSFGVLVLEIISGRRNKGVYLSAAEEYLLGKAWTLWKEGNGLQLIDASLDASVFMTEILRCMKVGLLCVQEQPEDRPIMPSVVLMLGSDHAFLPEPKQPGFMARVSPTESQPLVKESSSINGLTLTMSLGR